MAENIRVLGGSTQLISMREAAARLDIPLSTFQKHYREWGVPARRIGALGQVHGAGAPSLDRGAAEGRWFIMTDPLACTQAA